jgi:hypothetical protein
MNMMNHKKLPGMTRNEVLSLYGRSYLPDSCENILVYIINKTWYNRKGAALYIRFNKQDIVDKILLQKNYL